MSTFKHILAGVALALVGGVTSVAQAQAFTQNFDGPGTPAGWLVQNRSTPVGPGQWSQGNETIFTSQAGAPSAYFADSFLAASANGGAISDWLLTPVINMVNGMTISFYARTNAPTANDPLFGGNNLELRLSSGSGTNTGSTATDLGSFTTLLRALNFDAIRSASGWTQYTATISGLVGTSGRLGFRYVVDDTTIHGDYIGLDTVALVPEPEMALLLLAGLPLIGLGRRRKARA